jgi:hypothetical protein
LNKYVKKVQKNLRARGNGITEAQWQKKETVKRDKRRLEMLLEHANHHAGPFKPH